jgi:hypothetical protein
MIESGERDRDRTGDPLLGKQAFPTIDFVIKFCFAISLIRLGSAYFLLE